MKTMHKVKIIHAKHTMCCETIMCNIVTRLSNIVTVTL